MNFSVLSKVEVPEKAEAKFLKRKKYEHLSPQIKGPLDKNKIQ
jgi:hypothetical protein